MPGKIRFDHRALLDVVIAYVDWNLETKDDVHAWHKEYRDYFTRHFNHKVDLILELSNFHVNPQIATYFGKYRAMVLSEYTNLSYRVNQASRERTFMYTSSAIHGAPANQYETIKQAMDALILDREKSKTGASNLTDQQTGVPAVKARDR
jgi:hypothetical protein